MTPHHFFCSHPQPIAQRLPAFVGQRLHPSTMNPGAAGHLRTSSQD